MAMRPIFKLRESGVDFGQTGAPVGYVFALVEDNYSPAGDDIDIPADCIKDGVYIGDVANGIVSKNATKEATNDAKKAADARTPRNLRTDEQTVLRSAGGRLWKITVGDDGVLSTVEIL